jgi:hypothetical protein
VKFEKHHTHFKMLRHLDVVYGRQRVLEDSGSTFCLNSFSSECETSLRSEDSYSEGEEEGGGAHVLGHARAMIQSSG